ncbi:MAG TPA: hypothetical protein EYG38_04790, partial [Verrucomicrobia bacterium]|nr:hypothetical protein [Verrucomicrobiota bacterium]
MKPAQFSLTAAFSLLASVINAAELPMVTDVESQPLIAATERLLEALEYVGVPILPKDVEAVQVAMKDGDAAASIRAIQEVLDQYVVAGVYISAESRVKVREGAAVKELVQQGWRSFLVKVHNEAGITPVLHGDSPNAGPQYKRSRGSAEPEIEITDADVAQRWLDLAMFNKPPLKPNLSGLELEYRIIQLYSRDVGKREARLAFNVGQGTQDIGFRNHVPLLFQCVPAVEIALSVLDFDGKPTSASFVIRDRFGRVYPNPARRLAPDFFFHNQIYRADGESFHLPPGDYDITVSRGPE